MPRSHSCPDCQVDMEIGFVPDYYARILQSRWHPGTATTRALTGDLKLEISSMIPITTFRCPQCGLLKHYAVKPVP